MIVDVTYGFTGHQREPILESVKTWYNSCGEEAWDAIEQIQILIKAAREKHIPIFYTVVKDYRPDGFDAGAWNRKNTRLDEPESIHGYSRNEIVREIAPAPHDIVIEKLKPSAFFGTPLTGYLVDLQVDTLLICGTTTSGCVRASVVDAFSLNYKVAVIEECTFDRGEASHAINLFDMNAKYADVITMEETLSYLQSVEHGLYDDKIKFE